MTLLEKHVSLVTPDWLRCCRKALLTPNAGSGKSQWPLMLPADVRAVTVIKSTRAGTFFLL